MKREKKDKKHPLPSLAKGGSGLELSILLEVFLRRAGLDMLVMYTQALSKGITPRDVEESRDIIFRVQGLLHKRPDIRLGLTGKGRARRVTVELLNELPDGMSLSDFEDLFNTRLVKFFIVDLYEHYKIGAPRKEKLHKQPRGLLKTIAKSISNTAEPTLFTIQEPQEEGGVLNVRAEISKNTAGVALYLIQLYQENNSKPLVIDNLAPIAEKLGCTNHRLKLYLLYLGGFVYPIVDRDEETKQLILTNEQLFKIEFRYSERVAQKYEIRNGEIIGAQRYGTGLLNFIKDEPLDSIKITPSALFIKAIQGKGLGNILTVSDKFLELVLELNDTAVKILTFTSSNQPTQKIGEDKLVAHLGLSRQVKVQGKPRVRATMLKGFQELKDRGHIKEYSYEDSTGAFTYTYSDMYVKFKEGKRGRPREPQKGIDNPQVEEG